MGACGVRDVVRMDAGELSDSEGATDQSDCESEVVRVCFPGFLKRTYGVDLASDASLERRRKSTKLDEQLDGLRAVLPDVATRSRERTNVVLDAYHYIAALQRELEDLNAELLEDAAVAQARGDDDDEQQQYCCEGQWNFLLSCHSGLRQQPLVDVARGDGLLEVRIVCANRPGLLVDVMEAVEARGLTIVQVRIACRDEIMVEYLTLESEDSESDLLSDGEKKADSSGDEEEEVDRVKAMLVHAICRGGNVGSEDLQ